MTRSLRSLTLLFTSLLMISFVSSALAGVKRITLEETILTAESVFVGRVAHITTRWGDNHKMIWTDYTFEVEERWKGLPIGPQHIVSVAGGEHNGDAIYLSHVPSFEIGATYILYSYERHHNFGAPTVGVEQGVFREVEDADTGQRVLVDYTGYLMERLADGTIVRGALTRKIGRQVARVLSESELIEAEREFQEQFAHASVNAPIYRDPYGHVIEAPAPPPDRSPAEIAFEVVEDRQRGVTLTREALHQFTSEVLVRNGQQIGPGSER